MPLLLNLKPCMDGGIESHCLALSHLVLHVCFLASLPPSGQGTLPPQHTFQLFTLAKNCLERAESIYTTVQREGRSFDTVRGSPHLRKYVCLCVCARVRACVRACE